MTVNTDGWHKQPHYTQLALDVTKRIEDTQLVPVTRPNSKETTGVMFYWFGPQGVT